MGSVFDLLWSLKRLCHEMWQSEVKMVDELHLSVALRMLKAPHFNARMNALKQARLLFCT